MGLLGAAVRTYCPEQAEQQGGGCMCIGVSV